MKNQIEEREELLDNVVKMLVDYDRYIEDKHHLLIHQAKQMVSATSLAIPKRPKDVPIKYWKYQTNPMIYKMANTIVGFMLTKRMLDERSD